MDQVLNITIFVLDFFIFRFSRLSPFMVMDELAMNVNLVKLQYSLPNVSKRNAVSTNNRKNFSCILCK